MNIYVEKMLNEYVTNEKHTLAQKYHIFLATW